jgi:hypothetical protein
MIVGPRAVLVATFAAAGVVFCVVQDRVTAAGARQYVALHQAGRAVTLDDVVAPAVRRSVRLGLASSGGVIVVGAGLALAAGKRRR